MNRCSIFKISPRTGACGRWLRRQVASEHGNPTFRIAAEGESAFYGAMHPVFAVALPNNRRASCAEGRRLGRARKKALRPADQSPRAEEGKKFLEKVLKKVLAKQVFLEKIFYLYEK